MTRWWSRLTDVSSAWRAACWYVGLTILMTWPLAPNLTSDVPGDLGDPLLNSWLLAHAANSWHALLAGDVGAAIRFWHAPFFHPEPLVTAYSDHFAAHSLAILPIWLLTKNIILCYNLLVLATFVLCGTGMYLLARELTGSARAGFVCGLVFMFSPYRFATLSHVQVLSSMGMPFALFGLHRYFMTGRKTALAGGAAAVLLQNLSSGYYMVYFAPFVALFAVGEMWCLRRRSGQARLIAEWRVWRDLAVAGVATLALTLPFAIPYVMLQRNTGFRRPLAEVEMYSADLLAWLTADQHMNVWGWLQAYPHREGHLFPGFVIVVLAVVGVTTVARKAGGSAIDVAQAKNDPSLPDAVTARATVFFALGLVALAMWMAMGPTPTVAGAPMPVPSLYRLFYEHVPGFDASRVPARFTTILVLFLAIAAAYGAAWLDRTRRHALLALAAIGALVDGSALPLKRNLVISTSSEVRPPAARVYPESRAPVIWRYLKTLPPAAVIAHFPFGYPEHEIRYLYYSRVDGHRLSNGYSGGSPVSYRERADVLKRVIERPDLAVARLRRDEVSYVVVHMELYPRDLGMQTVAALEGAGLRPITRIGTVYVLEVPR